MARRRHRVVFAIVGVVALADGCASSGLSPLFFAVRRVPGVERATVLEVTESVLVRLGYGIDRVQAASSLIATRPLPGPDQGAADGGSASGTGDRRRLARVHVTEKAGEVSVFCSVMIQEHRTEAHRMLFHDRGSTDVPDETPIEREAATTADQNTVWESIRRDKAAEQHILEDVLQEIGR